MNSVAKHLNELLSCHDRHKLTALLTDYSNGLDVDGTSLRHEMRRLAENVRTLRQSISASEIEAPLRRALLEYWRDFSAYCCCWDRIWLASGLANYHGAVELIERLTQRREDSQISNYPPYHPRRNQTSAMDANSADNVTVPAGKTDATGGQGNSTASLIQEFFGGDDDSRTNINIEVRGMANEEETTNSPLVLPKKAIRKELGPIVRESFNDDDLTDQTPFGDVRSALIENQVAILLVPFGNKDVAALLVDRTCGDSTSSKPVCLEKLDEIKRQYADYIAGTIDCFPELKATVERHFWEPVRQWLKDNVNRAWIVTGPGLHHLPFELGAPPMVAISRVCGYPYLSLLINRGPDETIHADASAPIVIAVDRRFESTAPLPFAAVEVDFNVHQKHCKEIEASALTSRTEETASLLLAGHGNLFGSTIAEQAGMLIMLEGVDVGGLVNQLAVREFLCLSCFVARAGHTHEGDATGLASLVSAHKVPAFISCTAGVSDFYAPLLSSLIRFYRRCGDDPALALCRAREFLLTKCAADDAPCNAGSTVWPRDLAEALRDSYRQVMLDVLEQIVDKATDVSQSKSCWPLLQGLSAWPYERSIEPLTQLLSLDPFDPTRNEQHAVMLHHYHRQLCSNHLETKGKRESIADGCNRSLFDRSWSQTDLQDTMPRNVMLDSIRRLCVVTTMFGDCRPGRLPESVGAGH